MDIGRDQMDTSDIVFKVAQLLHSSTSRRMYDEQEQFR